MFILAAVVAVLSLVLTATVSGVFFAFSNSIMPGLDAVAGQPAIDSFTSIDRKILNPVFLLSFVGPLFTGLAAGILIMIEGSAPAGLLFLAATAIYLLGSIVPTAVVNVPMNNALQSDPTPTDPTRAWADFSSRWTRWNNVRAVASLLAVALSGIGLLIWGYAD